MRPRTAPRRYRKELDFLTALSRTWYWEQDERYRYTRIAGGATQSPGAGWQQALGKTQWESACVPAGDGGSWQRHKALLDARQPFADFVVKRADRHGEVQYISSSGEPLFDGKSRFRGYRGIARDVTESRRADELLRLEHAVTLCLAEADSVAAALQGAIRAICETENWEYGQYWRMDEQAGTLAADAFWVAPGAPAECARFIEASRGVVFRPGVGLIGTVYRTGQPLWVSDVASDPRVLRKDLAREAGLRGAFRFAAASGAQVLGVFDFACRRLRDPDSRLLQALRIIGSQIGQFLQRKQADERARYLATHDALTALPNRMMFSRLLDHAILLARRQGRGFAVMFVDLDGFKLINDTHGHEAGDALLKEVGKRFSECLRASDVVARLGGDEFVLLLQESASAGQIAAVAGKLLSAAIRPVLVGGLECRVSASIGISVFPADGEDEQALMKSADIAMYLAKEEGRNNFQFYSEDIRRQSLERLTLETGLRHALERGEFSLHYQAKQDLETGRIAGVEALLRWQHPDLGTISPARFLPIAEESGLIVPIGRWVFGTACAQSAAWQRAGLPPICIAINLSARQFADPSLIGDLSAALEQGGTRPESIELELSENMVIRDPERAIQRLAALKRLGVRIALDDFGVGYSSLAQVKRYPIDTLKVDRSFIRDLAQRPENKAITEAIIAIGKTLSLTVIAEGVETQEQARFLREHACDQMQGYLYSRPIPPEDMTAMLARGTAGRESA